MSTDSPRRPRIDHIGVAVPDLAEALPFFRDFLGMPEVPLKDSDGAKIRAVKSGESMVELLEPETDDSPIGKYLGKKGPGIHHVCLAVDDLEGTLARAKAAGLRLIDEVPRIGAEGKRIAFLHPKSTAGILVELTEY